MPSAATAHLSAADVKAAEYQFVSVAHVAAVVAPAPVSEDQAAGDDVLAELLMLC